MRHFLIGCCYLIIGFCFGYQYQHLPKYFKLLTQQNGYQHIASHNSAKDHQYRSAYQHQTIVQAVKAEQTSDK